MYTMICLVIVILFLVFLFWTWNNTRYFDNVLAKILFVIIGTLSIALITYIIFLISTSNIYYMNNKIYSILRNVILLVFIPINGFLTLPRIANMIGKIKKDEITGKKLKKYMILFIIITIIVIVIEVYYFKGIQNRIMQIIKFR